jgi:hypothetical protein
MATSCPCSKTHSGIRLSVVRARILFIKCSIKPLSYLGRREGLRHQMFCPSAFLEGRMLDSRRSTGLLRCRKRRVEMIHGLRDLAATTLYQEGSGYIAHRARSRNTPQTRPSLRVRRLSLYTRTSSCHEFGRVTVGID